MANDISSKTILVLVLLTLSVSLVGTFAVTSELAKAPVVQEQTPPSSGEINLQILSQEKYEEQQRRASGNGKVAITIAEEN